MTKMPVNIFSNFNGRRYSTLFPYIDAVTEIDVAYPFYVYDVLLAIGKVEKDLNIFEEAVLKLTAVTSGNIEVLSNSLCLSADFVAFIQNKLRSLQLVDERYNITEKGKIQLARGSETEKIEYVPVKVFVDPNTGLKLPFVNIGKFLTEKFFVADNKHLTFSVGTEGKTQSITAAIVNPQKDIANIAPSEIENIVRKYNKVRTNSNRYHKYLYCAFTEKTNISSTPELVYVHLKLVTPDGNSDKTIISDGFSVDIDFLMGVIKANRLVISKLRSKGIKDTESERFVKRKAKNNYYELFCHWDGNYGAQVNLEELKKISRNTTDSRKKYYDQYTSFIRNLYGALEWCLYYALSEQPPLPGTIEGLYSALPQNNQYRLVVEAKNIGLPISPKNQGLFTINSLGIKNYENGTPDMFSCLALFLLDDGENNKKFQNAVKEYYLFLTNVSIQDKETETNMHEFLTHTENLIDFFAELKQLRDSASHIEDSENVPTLSDLTDIYEFSTKFISIVLPNFQSTKSVVSNDTNISQERIKATYLLEEELGFENFQSMPVRVKNALIRLESIRTNFSAELAGDYIIALAKIAEDTLLQAVCEIKDSEYTDCISMKEKAFNKICSCSGKDIDIAIASVRDNFIRQALRGNSATLGAYLIAYFAYASEETIAIVNKSCSGNFVKTFEKLLKYRGHANKKVLNIIFEELENLRKDLIKIICLI